MLYTWAETFGTDPAHNYMGSRCKNSVQTHLKKCSLKKLLNSDSTRAKMKTITALNAIFPSVSGSVELGRIQDRNVTRFCIMLPVSATISALQGGAIAKEKT